MYEPVKKQQYVLWITRSFLDYRVPVFRELDRLLDHRLKVIYSRDKVPDRVCINIRKVLGRRAIGISGEWSIGSEGSAKWANRGVAFNFHPGLFRLIKAHSPVMLIGDGFFKWTFVSVLHRLIHRTPLIICYERTFHTERTAQWYRTAYRRLILRLTDAMCCNGRLCVEYVRWLGMPSSRITTGHMAADTEVMREKAEQLTLARRHMLRQQWSIKGPVFLYVGQFIPRKGIRQLLDAWTEFERDSSNRGTLVLVGEGPLSDQLYQQTARRNLQRVRFLGRVEYDNLATVYAVSDILVMPTLEDNWSLVVPEAMACGLPVLCSKYNGCWPELVKKEENGWVFDPQSPKDFLEKLQYCVERRDQLKNMGEESKKIIAEHSPARAAHSILSACEIALKTTQCTRAQQFQLQMNSFHKI